MISIPENLNPHSEAVRFALQILYRSTPGPVPFYERRSGYALPEEGFLRVEGLSANGNLVDLGLLALIRNFSGAYDGGNRVRLAWEVTTENVPFLKFFEVLVAKSTEGLDAGTIPGRLAGGTLGPLAYVPGQEFYGAVDRNAGRTGSKINLYTLRAVFANGTPATSDPIVVDLTDVLKE